MDGITISVAGALVSLAVAIVLILKKVQPTYAMIFGAIVGGLVGGAGLSGTVDSMISGTQGMISAIIRIVTAGILAGALIESGARSAEINRVMFDTKSRTAIALLKRVYSDMEFFHGGRCAVLCLTQQLIDETDAQESDLDGISATVRQVEGVLLGLTIRERGENEYKISLRAAEPANAAEICAQFGGGGHRGAAGCTIHAPLEAVKAQIVEACGRALEGLTPPGPLL